MSSVTNMSSMFKDAIVFNQSIDSCNVNFVNGFVVQRWEHHSTAVDVGQSIDDILDVYESDFSKEFAEEDAVVRCC